MIFHHTGDSHELEFQPFGMIHLPAAGSRCTSASFTIDLSPTKHVVLIVLAAVIVFVMLKAAAIGVERARKEGRAPARISPARMEAFVLWARAGNCDREHRARDGRRSTRR